MNNGFKEATIEKQCHQFLETDSFNWIKVPLKKFLIPAVSLTPLRLAPLSQRHCRVFAHVNISENQNHM